MDRKVSVDLLIARGLVNQEQLAKAQEEVGKIGVTLEKALELLGIVSEVDIANILAESMGVPFMDLTDYLIDFELIKLIPEETSRKHKVIPLFKIGDTLTVAMADPQDITAIDEIRKKSKFAAVDPVLSTPDMIERVIEQYYGALGNIDDLVKDLTKDKMENSQAKGKSLAEIAEDAPVVKLVNLIILQAVKDRASDIHIEPGEKSVLIRYRVDGLLYKGKEIPKHLQSALASRIKVMADMDIAETRKPQDGRIRLQMASKDLDLRISSFPTIHGENIVMRILDKSAVLLNLKDIGFSPKSLKKFDKAIRCPNGIILVTGPTGSGKTTTLYSVLSAINSIEKNIITIEDPVEYELSLIRQTQVNPKIDLTFSSGLRNILRQDPDIVMVGEIRDKETADIAIRASLTGHLVFSTLHTNSAASSLSRLLDMGVDRFLVSTSVIAILAQRLVRSICVKCKEKYTPAQGILKELNFSAKDTLCRGKGCKICNNTGFRGRIGIFELLLVDEEIKEMIVNGASVREIEKRAIALGMQTLYSDGLEKVKQGNTTLEEILKATEET